MYGYGYSDTRFHICVHMEDLVGRSIRLVTSYGHDLIPSIKSHLGPLGTMILSNFNAFPSSTFEISGERVMLGFLSTPSVRMGHEKELSVLHRPCKLKGKHKTECIVLLHGLYQLKPNHSNLCLTLPIPYKKSDFYIFLLLKFTKATQATCLKANGAGAAKTRPCSLPVTPSALPAASTITQRAVTTAWSKTVRARTIGSGARSARCYLILAMSSVPVRKAVSMMSPRAATISSQTRNQVDNRAGNGARNVRD